MRLVRVAAAVAVGVAVLAGCSDDGTANQTLPSTSSTPAQTTESLPPLGPPDFPVPDEAREQTLAGAKAFAQYYLALINRLPTGLDAQPLRELSRSCDTCDRIADDADRDAQAGYSYRGGALTITSLGEPALDGLHAELAFVVEQAPLEVIDATGAPVEALSSPLLQDLPAGASLLWAENHWLVSSLSFG